VTINGTLLFGGGANIISVVLGNVSATLLNFTSSQIIVRVNSGVSYSGTVAIQADTGATTVGGSWQQLTDSVITSAYVPDGQVGSIVSISGQRLLCGGSSVASVTLANVSATIQFQNNTLVVVVANIGTPGQGDIVVTANTGAYVKLFNGWSFATPGAVHDIQPTSGQFGTIVAINGTKLRGSGDYVAQVWFGSVPATILSENDTHVQVRVANYSAAGTVNVVLVANTGATVTFVQGWTFITTGSIVSVQPAFGQVGTRVVLLGQHLLGGGTTVVSVTLNGAPAGVVFYNDTEIHLVAGAGQEGLGDVVIITETGATTISAGGFRYGPLGVVTSLFPAQGRTGTIVTICGTNLLQAGTQYSSVIVGNRSTTILASNSTCVKVRLNYV
jgi:hypothetical protein